MEAKAERWTKIEHLPQWDEEFYSIYTAKKFGKWVMIKTLRPEYADKPEYLDMIGREFDARYNLAHPNIVMINDFEEIPGIGRCIVTDDVYGDSLRKLIDEGKVTDHHISQMRHQLVSALEYIENNHIAHPALTADNIIFTENIGNLKLIDVGFEQRASLTPREVSDDIYNYGVVLGQALEAAGNDDPVLRRVVRRCTDDRRHRYRDMSQLHLALEGRSQRSFYYLIFSLVAVVAAVVAVLVATAAK